MSTYTVVSNKFGENGFPYGTRIRVESVWGELPPTRRRKTSGYKERRLVWQGEVSGMFTRNFDPGKYIWKASKHDPAGQSGFKDTGTFLVDMTDEQWSKISHMSPRNQKPSMTTDGIVWVCQFTGCERRTTSKISATLHEASDHYGEDLLRSENPSAVKSKVDQMITESQEAVDRKKKIRGG